MFEEKFKVEETVDERNNRIQQLELELQRAKEEVACRKLVIAEMTSSLLRHEEESAELAEKMTMLKNQMMESDMASGIRRKYTAVRVGAIRQIPCTVSILSLEC